MRQPPYLKKVWLIYVGKRIYVLKIMMKNLINIIIFYTLSFKVILIDGTHLFAKYVEECFS